MAASDSSENTQNRENNRDTTGKRGCWSLGGCMRSKQFILFVVLAVTALQVGFIYDFIARLTSDEGAEYGLGRFGYDAAPINYTILEFFDDQQQPMEVCCTRRALCPLKVGKLSIENLTCSFDDEAGASTKEGEIIDCPLPLDTGMPSLTTTQYLMWAASSVSTLFLALGALLILVNHVKEYRCLFSIRWMFAVGVLIASRPLETYLLSKELEQLFNEAAFHAAYTGRNSEFMRAIAPIVVYGTTHTAEAILGIWGLFSMLRVRFMTIRLDEVAFIEARGIAGTALLLPFSISMAASSASVITVFFTCGDEDTTPVLGILAIVLAGFGALCSYSFFEGAFGWSLRFSCGICCPAREAGDFTEAEWEVLTREARKINDYFGTSYEVRDVVRKNVGLWYRHRWQLLTTFFVELPSFLVFPSLDGTGILFLTMMGATLLPLLLELTPFPAEWIHHHASAYGD